MSDVVVEVEPVEASLDDLPYMWVLGLVVIGALIAGLGTLALLSSLHS